MRNDGNKYLYAPSPVANHFGSFEGSSEVNERKCHVGGPIDRSSCAHNLRETPELLDRLVRHQLRAGVRETDGVCRQRQNLTF
jgi:hypothetical protein